MAMTDFVQSNGPMALAIGGLVIGAAFGAITALTNFCTMGALSDIHNFGDHRRFRAWILASATALLGTQALHAIGVVNLPQSMYLAPSLNWVGHILGGLLFGYGMVFAGGCASRNLTRLGGGDLRSLVVLIVTGLVSYVALGGILGPVRSAIETSTAISLAGLAAPTQGLGDISGSVLKLGGARASQIIAGFLALGAVIYCFGDKAFRSSSSHILSGLGIGLTIVAGWALTGLAFDELATRPMAPVSLTYVRPSGDTIEWLARFTAQPLPGFGVASVLGAIFGAFLVALAKGRLRITGFADTADTVRSLVGAAMMGVGGVLALGCTVGQAITGLSTLALGSFITFAALVIGGRFGLRDLERRLMAS
jgi:uncharacterized protein